MICPKTVKIQVILVIYWLFEDIFSELGEGEGRGKYDDDDDDANNCDNNNGPHVQ